MAENGPYRVLADNKLKIDADGIYWFNGFFPKRLIPHCPLVLFEGGKMSSGGWYRYLMYYLASWGYSCIAITPPEPKSNDDKIWTLGFEHAKLWATYTRRWDRTNCILAGHSWGGDMSILKCGEDRGFATAVIAMAPGWPVGGPDPLLAERIRNAPRAIAEPIIYMAGDLDENTGVEASESFYNVTNSPQSFLQILHGGIHASFIGNEVAYLAAAMLEQDSPLSHAEMLDWVKTETKRFLDQFAK